MFVRGDLAPEVAEAVEALESAKKNMDKRIKKEGLGEDDEELLEEEDESTNSSPRKLKEDQEKLEADEVKAAKAEGGVDVAVSSPCSDENPNE